MTPTQRAAMEQALEVLEQLQGGCTDSDDGTVEVITVWCPEVIDTLRTALAEQPAIPPGYKLVPVEPTPEMLNASLHAHDGKLYPQDFTHGPKAMNADVWAAMLAAAPEEAPQPAKPAQAVVQVPPNNDLELLLRQVFAFCEATEDATEVEPKNEHQRGFDKGRRFEAKQIRRSIGDWFQAEFCGRSFMGEPVVAAAPEAPQPRRRLSDEEVEAVIASWWRDDLKMKYAELCRAIEAAVWGEKT